MLLLKIALRNLWRNKRRSLILIASVTVGIWFGIFLMSFYNGMIEDRIQTAVYSELSHFQLHHPEFRKDRDIKFFIPEGKKILQKFSEDTLIHSFSGRIILNGMIASPAGSSGILINGIMPEKEKELTGLDKKLIAGNYFDPSKSGEIIISDKLCKKLKLKLHKKAVITFQDSKGEFASIALRIKGVYKTINGPYDDRNIFVKLDGIDSLAGIPGQLNEIAVLLKSGSMLNPVMEKHKKENPGVEFENWMELEPELGLTVSVLDQMVYLFMGVITLALAFGIINTMMMSVLERTREIGMLIALGMTRQKIFMMIMLETCLLSVAGIPVGILIALAMIGITGYTGIDFSAFTGVYSSFGYHSIIYPKLSSSHLFTTVILVIATALISSVFPAIRALKSDPSESLKK